MKVRIHRESKDPITGNGAKGEGFMEIPVPEATGLPALFRAFDLKQRQGRLHMLIDLQSQGHATIKLDGEAFEIFWSA